jgi:outer membrane protein assembly factor BamB
MARKLLIGAVAVALLVVGIGVAAIVKLRERPAGHLDTELRGVSLETSMTEEETAPTTTAEEPERPPERCWRNFGGNPRRSLATGGPTLGRPTKVLWRRNVDDLMEYPPTYCNGRVFVNLEQKGTTLALDVDTGKILWRSHTRGPIASSPAIGGDFVIVSAHDGTVRALEAANGRLRWRLRAGSSVESSPVVIDDTVYVGASAGRLFALSLRSGRVRWAFDTGGRISSSPSILKDRVYITTYSGAIFCLNRYNGNKVWSTYVRRNSVQYESFYASPSTDGARVFAAARTGKVVALGPRSGQVLWTSYTGALTYATPAVYGSFIYIGNFSGDMQAFRKRDGKLAWRTHVPGEILAPALVVGDLVFFSTLQGQTYGARASNGQIFWRYPRGRYAPGIATDQRYIFSMKRLLVVFKGARRS